MTVDDSLFLGTWTDKQSSIPYHDVCDAGLDFVGFFSLRWYWARTRDKASHDRMPIPLGYRGHFSVCGVTCRRFGCGDGIREEGLRDDYLELKFYTVLRA
ncbi:hypothetical protein TNCV_764761 [Trichonephila clavipes]|nr:hypothetical protein TNCV_764761 [Trichonephila clavipes]